MKGSTMDRFQIDRLRDKTAATIAGVSHQYAMDLIVNTDDLETLKRALAKELKCQARSGIVQAIESKIYLLS
jgi:hypothetical protein